LFLIFQAIFPNVKVFSDFGSQLHIACPIVAPASHFFWWCGGIRRDEHGQVRCFEFLFVFDDIDVALCVYSHLFCICSLFAWHLKASSAWVAVDEEALNFSHQHGISKLEAAFISAALADGKSSICIRSSLYKLDAKSSSVADAPRIQLLKTGVFDGAVSPAGQEFISLGPAAKSSAR